MEVCFEYYGYNCHVRRRVIFCFLVSTIRKLETNKLSVLSAENATATAREGNRN